MEFAYIVILIIVGWLLWLVGKFIKASEASDGREKSTGTRNKSSDG